MVHDTAIVNRQSYMIYYRMVIFSDPEWMTPNQSFKITHSNFQRQLSQDSAFYIVQLLNL